MPSSEPIAASQPERSPSPEGAGAALPISNGIVGIVSRATGRGPMNARTTLNTNVIVVVMRGTLTRGERTLLEAGRRDLVEQVRLAHHEAMRPQATALVEEVTGRRVVSCLAAVDAAADVASLTFVLDERRESGHVEVAERREDDDG